jgi:hypothetical protein
MQRAQTWRPLLTYICAARGFFICVYLRPSAVSDYQGSFLWWRHRRLEFNCHDLENMLFVWIYYSSFCDSKGTIKLLIIRSYVFCMAAISESNRIAHEVFNAHREEIKKRKGDIVVIDIAQKKVLDVINKDDALNLIQKTAGALHRHIYLLNINPDKPLVWAR